MKPTSTFTKLSVAALGLALFSSCSKNEDLGNTNLAIDRKNDSQAQTINETSINSTTIWQDQVNGVDYMVNQNVRVESNLTIKPGVTVMFADGAGLEIGENGSITAIGEDGNLIYFTSKSGKRSAWKGITILSNNAKNVLSHVKVEHGGAANNFGTGNIIVGQAGKSAQVEISNSEITASGTDGIVVAEGSKLVGFADNNIFTNSAFPVNMHITDAANIENTNQYSNNGKEYIKLNANGDNLITLPINLKKLSESFLLSGKVTVGNTFTIAAGSRVAMDNNAEIVIDGVAGHGSFYAVGTQSQPINIVSVYNGTGIWKSIRFRSSNSDENTIQYCNISGGGFGTGNGAAMISVVNDNGGSSNIVIRNSNIMNSAAVGIYIQSANSEYNSDIIYGNVYSNNVKGNIQID